MPLKTIGTQRCEGNMKPMEGVMVKPGDGVERINRGIVIHILDINKHR